MNLREELTNEWKMRGVQEGKEYSILTAEIARATFGVTPGAHSRFGDFTFRHRRNPPCPSFAKGVFCLFNLTDH
mgnify:CR=1 FL=1